MSKLSNDDFSKLIRQLMEAPVSMTKTLDTAKLISVDHKNGRVAIKDICPICKHENFWDNAKLFTMNFLPCRVCGQKYNVPLVDELRANIYSNIQALLNKYGKLAVWGINYHSSDLFKKSTVLKKSEIYPVDISETKRMMELYDKKIYHPDIISSRNIKAVIVAIPVYLTQITSQIKANYPEVTDIIDICNLTDRDYTKKNI